MSIEKLSPEQRAVYDVIALQGPIGGREITEHLFPGVVINKASKEWAGVRKKLARLEALGLIVKGEKDYACVQGVPGEQGEQGEQGVPGTPGTPKKVKERVESQIQKDSEEEQEREPELPSFKKVKDDILGPGRPTLYLEEFCERARDYCLLGATNKDLAIIFNVCEQTILNWMNAHPEFLGAVHEGRHIADARVAKSLFQRATGYDKKTEKVFCFQGSIIRAEVIEHYPPDVGAAKLWLCNRQPDKWRDKVEYEPPPDGSAIPWDELEQITQKSLAEAEEKHRELVEGRAERLGIKLDYTSEDESD